MSIPVSALIAGRPDPEHDRVQLNVRQRRDVTQALGVISRMTGRSRERLIQDALVDLLRSQYPELFAEVHRSLYGG